MAKFRKLTSHKDGFGGDSGLTCQTALYSNVWAEHLESERPVSLFVYLDYDQESLKKAMKKDNLMRYRYYRDDHIEAILEMMESYIADTLYADVVRIDMKGENTHEEGLQRAVAAIREIYARD